MLTTRKEIVDTRKIIASELTQIQHAFFDEEMLQYYKDDNEELLYWEQFDCLEKEQLRYGVHNKIISLDHPNISAAILSEKLLKLLQEIQVSELYILAHLKLDFFGNRDNNFEPLVSAYRKLENIVGANSYKEAFAIGTDELPDFIEVLFWMIRCDPGSPEFIFLFDKNESVQLNLCRYGNIHLTEFEQERLTEDVLASLGWTCITTC